MFTLGFCQDAPHLLAAGGAKGTVSVWDVRRAVGARYPQFNTLAVEAAAAASDDAQ